MHPLQTMRIIFPPGRYCMAEAAHLRLAQKSSRMLATRRMARMPATAPENAKCACNRVLTINTSVLQQQCNAFWKRRTLVSSMRNCGTRALTLCSSGVWGSSAACTCSHPSASTQMLSTKSLRIGIMRDGQLHLLARIRSTIAPSSFVRGFPAT